MIYSGLFHILSQTFKSELPASTPVKSAIRGCLPWTGMSHYTTSTNLNRQAVYQILSRSTENCMIKKNHRSYHFLNTQIQSKEWQCLAVVISRTDTRQCQSSCFNSCKQRRNPAWKSVFITVDKVTKRHVNSYFSEASGFTVTSFFCVGSTIPLQQTKYILEHRFTPWPKSCL